MIIIIIINNYTHQQQLTHRCRMLKLLISHINWAYTLLSYLVLRKGRGEAWDSHVLHQYKGI